MNGLVGRISENGKKRKEKKNSMLEFIMLIIEA